MGLLQRTRRKFELWLLEGKRSGASAHDSSTPHKQHPWWQVMCLTGVDYFSTLGYQPGIAFLAAGALSPVATLVLVFLTLFGALPMYRRVAAESPHGDGSISMLENLLSRWKGKLFVLALLGFATTSFIITITLSAADATAHIVENPFVVDHTNFEHHRIIVTLVLISGLGAIFLRGFKEAIGIAVILVAIYLALNLAVLAVGFYEIITHPSVLANWRTGLFQTYRNPLIMVGTALVVFPKLALGLSGFETGVVVMPLVRGLGLQGRIHNARKLLTAAALIMSFLLLASSIVTTLLIPPEAFQPETATHEAGSANGRALAYVAHTYLGNVFGTAYDISTISILWFAGSSALAGLLNIVPRYLPRYGMAPEWARATRPLVVVFTLMCFVVTILFRADVDAQGGAYATGVLALMTSAAIAVTLSARRLNQPVQWLFMLISLVFLYTTVVNIIEQPEGIKIALIFIAAIVVSSLFSRVWRSTELRVDRIELDDMAREFIRRAAKGTVRIITNRVDRGDAAEYEMKEKEKRMDNHIPAGEPILFFEVTPGDASEFSGVLKIRGETVDGFQILRTESPAVPNAIAAFLLFVRNETGKLPHVYFGWSEGNPVSYLLKYIAFGEGDTAPVTHEVLRQAEKDPDQRPIVHVGG
ncbi:MAG: amino acid transporter [Pyrinomonadaceae bacterium]